MKNLKIKLGIITGLLFTSITGANRDSVYTINYKGNIHNPYNLKITTINTACDNKETSYEGNVFSELNFGSDTGLSCVKTGIDNLTCNKSIVNNGPSSSFNEKFYIYSSYKNLANKLGVPLSISDKLSGTYKQEFNLKMLLSTDSNGTNMNQMTYFDFSQVANPFGVKIKYSDQNECRSKCAKEDILNSSGAKIGEKINCLPYVSPEVSCIDCDIKDINDNKKPSEFGDIKIEGCNEIGGEFYCLANSSFNFKVSLSELGFDGSNSQGINSLKVGINNFTNNTQLSNNSWKNFTDFIKTSDFSPNILVSDDIFEKKGSYTLEITGKGGNGAYIYQITPIYKKIHILPNNDFKIASTSISSTNGYANNSDKYIVTANITDSFGNKLDTTYSVNNASIIGEGFDINKIDSGFQGEGLSISNSKFENNKFTFDLQSYSPGTKTVNFKISIPEHEMNPSLSAKTTKKDLNFNQIITFLKPFTTSNLSIVNANKKLEIGPSLNMTLDIFPKTSLSKYLINDFSDNIRLNSDTHEFKKSPIIIDVNNLKYSFTIDAKTNNGINIAPSITLNQNPVISYSLDGKNIKYYVNKSTNPTDNTKLSLSGVAGISGIKVVGTSQTTGKSETTNNIVNFTDLSKSTLRSTVKKNSAIITKGMKSRDLANRVLYYDLTNSTDKNIKYNDIKSKDFETLVIKNGNFIINENINKEKLGIIILKDGYNVNSDYNNRGNIYINPDVNYIKASIYADGGLISSDSNGIPYTSNTDERTNKLDNQLVIKGSILTRNTIGGAVNAGGRYILPGGEKTSNFDKAMIYDLNYIRRGNNLWDSNKTLNNNNSDNFVIIYNSSIQTNPPKGFNSN